MYKIHLQNNSIQRYQMISSEKKISTILDVAHARVKRGEESRSKFGFTLARRSVV